MKTHFKWGFALVLALVIAASTAGGSTASPQPSCAVDEYGNCIDSNSCYDNIACASDGYDEIEGDGTWGDSYDYYSTGGGSCAYAGAHRKRHAPIGHLWTMYFQVYYCWNGNEVTRLTPVGPWGQDFIGWPWYYAYGVSWNTTTEPTGIGPHSGSYAYLFTQMAFTTCFIGKPICAPTIHPWIEIVVYANGYAVCYSDVDYIGECRGVKYR